MEKVKTERSRYSAVVSFTPRRYSGEKRKGIDLQKPSWGRFFQGCLQGKEARGSRELPCGTKWGTAHNLAKQKGTKRVGHQNCRKKKEREIYLEGEVGTGRKKWGKETIAE